MHFPKSDGMHVPDNVWVSNGMMAFPYLERNVFVTSTELRQPPTLSPVYITHSLSFAFKIKTKQKIPHRNRQNH